MSWDGPSCEEKKFLEKLKKSFLECAADVIAEVMVDWLFRETEGVYAPGWVYSGESTGSDIADRGIW